MGAALYVQSTFERAEGGGRLAWPMHVEAMTSVDSYSVLASQYSLMGKSLRGSKGFSPSALARRFPAGRELEGCDGGPASATARYSAVVSNRGTRWPHQPYWF